MAEVEKTPYTQHDRFLGTYEEANSTQHEDKVGAMWSAILTEGYVNAPQYENQGGFTDTTTMQWRRNRHDALYKQVSLVTQTKRARYTITRRQWAEGEEQLRRYLAAHHQEAEEAEAGESELYGIVAIGRWTNLYQYNGETGQLMFILKEGGPYHVREGANEISRHLDHMKRNH
ncbi:hypothetical protein BJX61DRAFT_519727 [Aspergillus egyptiacus]|nr:hypothetical protein BJX61DRAFT_519727 [Aspergillus egyptiacus]